MTRTTRFLIDCAAILPLTAVVFWRVYRPDQSIFDVTGHVLGRDFVNVWIGGGLFAAGRTDVPFNFIAYREAIATWLDTFAVSGVLPDGVRETDYLWAYPPTAGLLAEPFAHLPYLAAYATWSVSSVGLLALAVAAVVDRSVRTLALTALLLVPATHVSVLAGQNGCLTAAILITAIGVSDRRPIAAGLLLGLLAIKPQMGLFAGLFFLARGQWQVIAAAGVSAVLLNFAALLRYGVEPFQLYFTHTLPMVRELATSFDGFQSMMMLSVFASARSLGAGVGLAMAIQGVVAIAVAITCLLAARRISTVPARLMFVALGTFLLTPYAFNYDQPILAAAIVVAIVSGVTMPKPVPAILLLLLLVPIAIYPLQQIGSGLAILPIAVAYAGFCRTYISKANGGGVAFAGNDAPVAGQLCDIQQPAFAKRQA